MNIVSHIRRFWRFHSLVIGALSVSFLTLGCAVHEPAFYEGTWVVTKGVSVDATNDIDTKTQLILGSSMTYSNEYAKLGQALCEMPTYTSKQVSSDALKASYHVSPQALGFSAGSITQVELACANSVDDIGATLLFQDHSLAYTTVDGSLFKIEKTL